MLWRRSSKVALYRQLAIIQVMQQRGDRSLESGQVFLRILPNLFQQNVMMSVDEHIAETSEIAPGNFGMRRSQVRSQALNCFADDHEAERHPILEQSIF